MAPLISPIFPSIAKTFEAAVDREMILLLFHGTKSRTRIRMKIRPLLSVRAYIERSRMRVPTAAKYLDGGAN